MKRGEILGAAADIVTKDREQQYGAPEDNFRLIAQYWTLYTGHGLTAHDVGVMLALLKIARIQSGQTKDDNYIDLAGYAACAGEIATRVNEHLPADYMERLEGLTFDQFGNVVRSE